MISRIAQCVWFLTKAFYCAFLPQPISNGLFLWSCRYGGFEGIPASHILLSQRPDPKEKQVINLDQDVQVCGYFFGGWCMNSFCMHHLSLFLSFWIRGYLFFFFFFDMPKHVAYLLWVCIFYSFFLHAEACGILSFSMHLLFSFCIAPYPWYIFWESGVIHGLGVLFCGWMCAYF